MERSNRRNMAGNAPVGGSADVLSGHARHSRRDFDSKLPTSLCLWRNGLTLRITHRITTVFPHGSVLLYFQSVTTSPRSFHANAYITQYLPEFSWLRST